MSFRVEPAALRRYADQLSSAEHVAEAAQSYVARHGHFSFHERGLIGLAAPGHRHLLADLTRLLRHLGELTDASRTAVTALASHYEHTDLAAESRIDASYPAVPRPAPGRD